jgi:hypothetical protein
MSILKTLEGCIGKVSPELIENKILYVELDKENYELFDSEISSEYILQEQKMPDIGKCKILTYLGYKVIIVNNKDRDKLDNFYIAFKTKIV